MEAELAHAEQERELYLTALRERGFLLAGSPTNEEVVEALHRYLVATPSRVLCAALTDAVGDRRTQNQPGTDKEYPNWRIPLSGPDGKPMLLEQLYRDERSYRLARIMNDFTAPILLPRSETELVV